MAKRAVFLDRDGTLIKNRHHASRPDDVELMDGVIEGLRGLQAVQYKLIVITNQSGIARGFFPPSAVEDIHARMEEILAAEGIFLSALYFCPHHPEGNVPEYAIACECRKPKPGLILRAATEQVVDATASWFVGDIMDDILAGRRAGCSTVLVNGWYERLKHPFHPHPHFMAKNFLDAAQFILARTR